MAAAFVAASLLRRRRESRKCGGQEAEADSRFQESSDRHICMHAYLYCKKGYSSICMYMTIHASCSTIVNLTKCREEKIDMLCTCILYELLHL